MHVPTLSGARGRGVDSPTHRSIESSSAETLALSGRPRIQASGGQAHSAAAAPDDLSGAQLGEYVIQHPIGQGGMGVVYEAVHPVSGNRMAVKVIRRELANNPKDARRFLIEARAINAIHHPGIVEMSGFGQLPDGRPYLMMERLDGAALNTLISESRPLAPAASLMILEQILSALAAAHCAGVIHRDLKPSNIFIVSSPNGWSYVKLLDFGIAKRSTPPVEDYWETRSSSEGTIGTPEYMAPEQICGEAVSPRTDLYAAGCVSFEMLTGRPPFCGGSPAALAAAHLRRIVPRPSSIQPNIPPEVDHLILQLLSKSPHRRPRNAQEARQAVAQVRTDLGGRASLFAGLAGGITCLWRRYALRSRASEGGRGRKVVSCPDREPGAERGATGSPSSP